MSPSPWVVTLAHKGVGEWGSKEGKEGRMRLLEPSLYPSEIQTWTDFSFYSPLFFLFLFSFSPYRHRIVLNLLNWENIFQKNPLLFCQSKTNMNNLFQITSIKWQTGTVIISFALLAYMLLWLHEACESPAAWSLKNAFEGVVREQAGEWGLIRQAEVMDVNSCSLGTMSQNCSPINIPSFQLPGASSCFKTAHLFSFLGTLMNKEVIWKKPY